MPGRDQFIVERYLAGEIVEWDLPLKDAEVTFELNREMMITGYLSADYVASVAQGMGLFPYNDCIHWVRDGVLRGGALIQPVAYDSDGNVVITARGWSTMLDVPIINGFSANGQESVVNVIHPLFNYLNDSVLGGNVGFFLSLQGQFNSLGGSGSYITTVDQPPGGRSGEGPTGDGRVQAFATGSLGGGSSDVGSGSSGGSSGSLGGSFIGPPNSQNTGTNATGQDKGQYLVMPWEAANGLEELRTLAEGNPADIVEHEEWDGATNNIKKTLKIISPRIGTSRNDLRFVEGENILQTFAASTSADDYANAILVIGSGSDDQHVVAYKYLDITNAARRVHVIEDETIYNVKIANAIANLELAQRSQAIHISSIVIDVDHPNAPIDSVKVGDDIRVHASLPFIGPQIVWHRIVSIRYRPGETSAEIGLARSDSFNYLFQG